MPRLGGAEGCIKDRKKIGLRKKAGGGVNRFVTVVLHGGGGVQINRESCYVICEWPQRIV